MNKLFKKTNILLLILGLVMLSCGKDDDAVVITVEDLVVTIDENPTNGDILGSVQTNSTASLSFSLTNQTPAGALSINATTGEVTVADAALFDFETNPIITATVSENGNTATVTINLNDLDEISAQDFTIAIDENPTDGQVVGAIQVNGGGTLTFTITSQTPGAALNINASTGELTVADPNLFDFETNPVITANIEVDNTINTVIVIATINLNDVDEITVQNLTVAIDENPTNGQVVGSIQATSTNSLSYAITFQSSAGALSINASTGELTVADASLFDFETTPSMFATISVDNSVYSVSATATITINDVDAIATLLSTSLSNYNAASIGDWIIVTEAEYDNIANNLNAITRAGTTVAEYNSPLNSGFGAFQSTTVSNSTTTSLIPSNGYIIAFKYKIASASTVTGAKLKQSSTANNSDFFDLGSVLPTHSGTLQDVFFVLKANNTPVSANSYLGFYKSTASLSMFVTTSNGVYWGSGDAATLNGQIGGRNTHYQGLSTTQMQW